jgi:hypothetical protein
MNTAIMKSKSLASLTVAAVASLVGSGAVASTYSAAVLALNPVGYWQLNGNTGDSVTTNPQSGTWVQGSGLGTETTGAYSPGPRPTDGFQGMSSANQAGDFNGGAAGRWVRIGPGEAQYDFDVGDPFSFVSWIKTSNTSDIQFILSKINTDPNGAYQGNTLLFIPVTAGPGYGLTGQRVSAPDDSLIGNNTTPLADGSWKMVVWTSSGGTSANVMSLYVNGVSVPADVTIDSFVSGNTTSDGPLTIGGRTWNPSSAFDGQIDESAVFNYALTSQEVSDLYQAAVVPEPSTLAVVGLGAIGVATYVRRRSRRECQR